jgi:predicted dinucleotide-binding enzyme
LLENGKPKGAPGRIALPVAVDDPKAKAIVMQLIDEIGFDPVDAGTIAESWRQQPATPVYAEDYDADGVRTALSEAKPERTPQFTGSANSPGTFESPV